MQSMLMKLSQSRHYQHCCSEGRNCQHWCNIGSPAPASLALMTSTASTHATTSPATIANSNAQQSHIARAATPGIPPSLPAIASSLTLWKM